MPRPVCQAPECTRLCEKRDEPRTGQYRWRTRCYWHKIHGDHMPAPTVRDRLTTGVQCQAKGCRRAPEAFRRPDRTVYIRPYCRVHRMTFGAKKTAKPRQSPKQPVPATVTAPFAFKGVHRRWQDTPLNTPAFRAKTPWIKTKEGIWVRDGALGWLVPGKLAHTWSWSEASTFDLAKKDGYPSRVIVLMQFAIAKGQL